MGGMPWYASRGDVQAALETESSAGTRFAIDNALASGARAMERSAVPGLGRQLFPRYATVYLAWPDRAQTRPAALYHYSHPLVTLTSLTSGGVDITAGAICLPGKDEPCTSIIELDQATGATLATGATPQRSVVLTGLLGYHDEQVPCGELAGSMTDSVTTLDMAVENQAQLPDVGHLLKIGSERLIVTDRRMIDTGVNTGGALDDSLLADTVAVADGTVFAPGETLLVGSERMWIRDIVGNTLHVRRAYEDRKSVV